MDMVKYTIIVFVVAIFVVFSFAIMFPKSFDQIRKSVELEIKTGTLSIGGKNPRIEQIYIENKACANTAGSPGVLGLVTAVIPKVIKAYIADDNGNCNSASATAYVCPAPVAGACNQFTSGVIPLTMTFTNSPDGNVHCNFTANTFNLYFYYRWGDWRINVTAIDPGSLKNSTVQYWYYNQMPGVDYPSPTSNSIDFGSLPIIGDWNDGYPASGNYINNTGNIRVNVTWNATDFTCQSGTCTGDTIPITNSPDSFCVDCDISRGSGCSQQCMNANELIQSWYIPSGQPASLKRCNNAACSSDEDGSTNEARYYLYWHIYVPNVREGNYQNNIQFSGFGCPTCGG